MFAEIYKDFKIEFDKKYCDLDTQEKRERDYFFKTPRLLGGPYDIIFRTNISKRRIASLLIERVMIRDEQAKKLRIFRDILKGDVLKDQFELGGAL